MLNFISTNVCNCPHICQMPIREGVRDALRANQDSELFQCVVNNTQQIVQRLSDLYQSQCEDMSQFYALFKSLPVCNRKYEWNHLVLYFCNAILWNTLSNLWMQLWIILFDIRTIWLLHKLKRTILYIYKAFDEN